jgi:hypothetical protein
MALGGAFRIATKVGTEIGTTAGREILETAGRRGAIEATTAASTAGAKAATRNVLGTGLDLVFERSIKDVAGKGIEAVGKKTLKESTGVIAEKAAKEAAGEGIKAASKKTLKESTGVIAEKAAKEAAGEGIKAASKKAAAFIVKHPKLVIAGLSGAAALGYLINRVTKNDNVPLKITKIERLSGLLSSSDTICDFHLAVEGRDMPEINNMGAIIIDTLDPNIPQLIKQKLNFVKVLGPKIVRIDISQIPNFANLKFEGLVGACTYRTSFQGELSATIKESSKTIFDGVLDTIVGPVIGSLGDILGFDLSPGTIKIIFFCIIIIIVLGVLRYTGLFMLIRSMFSSLPKPSSVDVSPSSYYYYGAGLPSV